MDPTTAPAIETSPQANLEVTPPVTASIGDMDWASRLDAAMDSINKETGATKHGKAEDPKSTETKPKTERKTKAAKPKAEPERSENASASDTSEKAVEKIEDPAESDKKDGETSEEPKTDETPKGLTEKAAVKWGELRNENRAYKKEIEILKAELEKAKSTPAADISEIERLKQINSEYEQELAIARVEATQEYKAAVVEPMVNVVDYLNNLASKYELNSKEMLAAFAETDLARQSDLISDIAASMNERDRLRFYASADDYAEIIRRRDAFQTRSRERMAQLESEKQAEIAKKQAESEKAAVEAKQAYEKATSKVFEDLKKSVPVLSDEEVAAEVQRLAKGDYTNADPELKAYLAHSGALLPHILKALKEAKSELDAANKKIISYRNGSPKAGGGSSETSKSLPEDVGFLEALDQQLG